MTTPSNSTQLLFDQPAKHQAISAKAMLRLAWVFLLVQGLAAGLWAGDLTAQERKKSKKKQELERREELRVLTEDYVPSASRDGHHKTFQSKRKVRQIDPENKHVEKSKRKRHKKERKQDRPPYLDGEPYTPMMPKKARKRLKKHKKKFRQKESPKELIDLDKK